MYYLILVALLLLSGRSHAQGWGGGGGGGGGPGSPAMNTIRKLIRNRRNIARRRPVNHTTGVSTFTKGNTTQVTNWIYQHVTEMMALRTSGGRIRNWDGLFRTMFEHSDDMDLECRKARGGVVCNNTGTTECAIDLAQAHAQVVSRFLKYGQAEVRKDHSDYVSIKC